MLSNCSLRHEAIWKYRSAAFGEHLGIIVFGALDEIDDRPYDLYVGHVWLSVVLGIDIVSAGF